MSKLRLGELLIQERKIDDSQLQSALGYQRRWGKKIGECLVQLGFLTEIELVQILSKVLRVPVIDLSKLDGAKITRDVLSKISLPVCRSTRIVPLSIKEIKGKKRLVVAMSDPTQYQIIDDLQFRTGLPVLPMVATDSDIEWFIRKFYMGEDAALSINFISGVSPLQHTADELKIDPVSSIFFDSEFTGMTNIGKSGVKSDPTRTSSKKTKT